MTWVSLTLWPFISTALFSNARLPIALLVTIIGGYLLLPTQTSFDLPVLPALNKHTVPALVAMIFVLIKSKPQGLRATQPEWPVLPGLLPRDPVVLFLFLTLFVGHLGTTLMNGDTLFYGWRVLPGLKPYDMLSAMLATMLQLMPFLLARKVLGSPEGQRLTLVVLAIAAAAYSIPIFYELRMSPQLNRIVYGFFPHDFAQHYRSWGWRPIMFLEHGLRLSLFLALAAVAAAVLSTLESGKKRTLWVFMSIWLFGMLVLSKSLGALLSATTALAVLYFLPKRLQILFAFVVTLCVLLYPIIRATNLVPYDKILEVVTPERAHSLAYRLDSEQVLLEKANERPIFGWGGWGRSRAYDNDGRDAAVPDGAWIIWLGLGGWMKYISIFGLLSWGSLQLFWQRGKNIDKVSVGLALALTVNLIDLIPNSGITPITWLLAGALCGRLEHKTSGAAASSSADPTPEAATTRQKPTYARNLTSTYSDVGARTPEVSRDTAPTYRRDFDRAKK